MKKQNHKLNLFGRIARVAPLGALLGLLVGCANDFDPGSRVTTLRVLAVQADAPFAAPGETVHLDSLSYDPQGRTVNWGWATCVNPPEATVAGCFLKIAEDSATSGLPPNLITGPDMTGFDLTVPADALSSLPANSRSNAVVGVLNAACPGTLSIGSSSTGLPIVCTDASGRELALDEFVVGIKRVRIRERDRNQNPVIAGITFDGADWPAAETKTVGHCDSNTNVYDDCKGDKHRLAAIATAASFESGSDEFGETFHEDLITEYYATEGIFKDEVRIAQDPETSWVARSAAAGRDLTLWFVVHDDRGGVSWETRQVHVN